MSIPPIKKQCYFITGTDTHVGKTFISCLLLARARSQGYQCYALKPITSGCLRNAQGKLISDDAERLKQFSNVLLDDDLIAPVRLATPQSPNIAALADGVTLQSARLVGFIRGALSTPASHILIEGAGGWRVPINSRETLADVAKQLNVGVILVVGVRLGCINHALLTVEAIARDGLRLVGWVANCLDDSATVVDVEAQIATLKARLTAPCLGVVTQGDVMTLIDSIKWPNECNL